MSMPFSLKMPVPETNYTSLVFQVTKLLATVVKVNPPTVNAWDTAFEIRVLPKRQNGSDYAYLMGQISDSGGTE